MSEADLDASTSQGANTSSHHVISCGHQQRPKECDQGIRLLSSIHAEELAVDGNLQNQQSASHESEDPLCPNSVAEPALAEEPVEAVLIARPVDYPARRKYFPPHWSTDAVSEVLEVA